MYLNRRVFVMFIQGNLGKQVLSFSSCCSTQSSV